jgi:hypothetical protein
MLSILRVLEQMKSTRWFFGLNGDAFAKHYDSLYLMSRFHKSLQVTICFVHIDIEKLRDYIILLPSSLMTRYAQLIVVRIVRRHFAEFYRMGRQTEKWSFKHELVQ